MDKPKLWGREPDESREESASKHYFWRLPGYNRLENHVFLNVRTGRWECGYSTFNQFETAQEAANALQARLDKKIDKLVAYRAGA